MAEQQKTKLDVIIDATVALAQKAEKSTSSDVALNYAKAARELAEAAAAFRGN